MHVSSATTANAMAQVQSQSGGHSHAPKAGGTSQGTPDNLSKVGQVSYQKGSNSTVTAYA